jgi:tetratricopeptide (TPR) repeat protein
MRNWSVLLVAAMLAGCASAPLTERYQPLFSDKLFAAPSERINADDVFALNDEMRRYLATEIAARSLNRGFQQGLIDALYDKNQLRLDYDTEITRNAEQTFAARSGNCLSLVIMAAALAKELGLPVRYQKVLVDDAWSRNGDMYFSSSHVNLTLGTVQTDRVLNYQVATATVDFVDPGSMRGRRLQMIREHTIVAMYMNNRAAESLVRGRLDDAYWWARAAIEEDPRFLGSYNTLGVVYRRHGNLHEADQVLSHVLKLEPGNTEVMSNLVLVLNDEGRVAEAQALARKLEQLQPYPPFYFFNLGQIAMREGDYEKARRMFAKEVDRDAYYHEFHFWLAAALVGLGEFREARAQLILAIENSTTRKEHDLYAAKLDRIRSIRLQ